jgi:hypothetical protein
MDCGNYAGTCGYLDGRNKLWKQCSVGGRGASGESCSCMWCPSTLQQQQRQRFIYIIDKACYSHDATCSAGTAIQICGDAGFCISDGTVVEDNQGLPCQATDGTGCKCSCKISGS